MSFSFKRSTHYTAIAATALAAALGLIPGAAMAETPARADKQAAAPSVDGPLNLDKTHTNVGFSVRHMVVSQVRGRFNDFSAAIVGNSKDWTKSSVKFTIQAASIDTAVPARDTHLKSADFFDAAKYPTITFESSKITKRGDNEYVAHGTFKVHGTAREIDLPFTVAGPVKDPFGFVRVGIESHLKLNRQDYGVKWNATLDNGGLAVGNEVDIVLDLEATAPK